MRVNNRAQVFVGDQSVIGYLNPRPIPFYVGWILNREGPPRFEVRGFHRRKYGIKPDPNSFVVA